MVRLAISERRDLLIAAAWRVMAREGVAAATTRAICAEANMPQSSFHYCFDTRADLLRIVVTSRMPDFITLSTNAIEAARTPTDRIRAALEAWWQDVLANPQTHAVMFDITVHAHYDPDLHDLGTYQYAEAHATVLTLLNYAVRDGQYAWDTDIEQLAVSVVAFLNGLSLRYMVEPHNSSFSGALDTFAAELSAHLTAVHTAASV
ncbi:TetR/AcrR family transcriptional regulator [Cumulibacter soli]|uniref:TetR/AcrR family transcriptional regulator n=1 Tax=Cumulibacter soli TaxID=2546344 RepID=UPI001067AF76|nr:TetR family transcriptional regulator C-terminal domain-containing protein [Cumulibacter soli]